MDASTKSHFSPELYIYAEKHNIFHLFEHTLERLIVERPNDPLDFLYDLFKKGFYDVIRVFVLGPPTYVRKAVCSTICLYLRTIHLTRECLFDAAEASLEKPLEIYTSKTDIPASTYAKLLKERVEKPDCVKNGWVLEGSPSTRQQAFALQKAGIFPTHIVILDEPEIAGFRTAGGLEVMPRDTAERMELRRFRNEINLIRDLYKRAYTKNLSTEMNTDILMDKVLDFVRTKPRSLAPYIPRILLFGPPGSGRKTITKMLVCQYDLIAVDFSEVLKQASMVDKPMKKKLYEILDQNVPVPDEILAEVAAERLNRSDCLSHGWVMYNFPFNVPQAKALVDFLRGFQVNRAIFLDIDFETCARRVEHRRLDPETGNTYHLINNPPPQTIPLDRLVQRPEDTRNHLLSYYRVFQGFSVPLKLFFSREVQEDIVSTVDSRGTLETTFEIIQTVVLESAKRKMNLSEEN